MATIPFEVQTTPAASERNAPKIWTVSNLTRHIRFTLESQFRSLTLEGELSNFKRSAPGHLYFQLKDPQSQIRGIMFRQATRGLRFEPTDGLAVVVRGHIAVYEPRGEYQFQVSSMEPKGIGSLQLAYEQLKEKLEKEGLFAATHKQQPPMFPRCIGLVTSPTGAVIHDMLNVHRRRCPNVKLVLFPANVQGEQAAPSLVEGIEYFNQQKSQQNIDVLIVGRGGGSIEDLWAFNDERVARAIFQSSIPVISAVGHETDFTIADFVSDLRAPTPSAAMELAVPKLQDLRATLEHYQQRLHNGINRHLQQRNEYLNANSQRLRSPEFIVHQHMQRLDDLSNRLQMQFDSKHQQAAFRWKELSNKLKLLSPSPALQNHQATLQWLVEKLQGLYGQQLEQKKEALVQRVALLDSLSPLAVMKRGYGIVMDKQQKPVDSIKAVKTGQVLNVQLKDGVLQTKVEKKEKNSTS